MTTGSFRVWHTYQISYKYPLNCLFSLLRLLIHYYSHFPSLELRVERSICWLQEILFKILFEFILLPIMLNILQFPSVQLNNYLLSYGMQLFFFKLLSTHTGFEHVISTADFCINKLCIIALSPDLISTGNTKYWYAVEMKCF